MLTVTPTQLSLFATCPPPAPRTKRTYCRHKQRHVVFLQKHYAFYTLKELARMLCLSEKQVFGLCRRNGIRKRAPNKAKAHNQPLALAA